MPPDFMFMLIVVSGSFPIGGKNNILWLKTTLRISMFTESLETVDNRIICAYNMPFSSTDNQETVFRPFDLCASQNLLFLICKLH